jgi:hypothetical protein
MARTISVLRWGGLGIAVGLLAACGYFSGASNSASNLLHRHERPPAHPDQPIDPAAQALAAMVEAVGPSGAQGPIELRFSIRDRPQVGQDDEVDYAVVPRVAGLATVRVAFGSLEGLQVVSHGPQLAAIRPAVDVPIFGSVTVRPMKAGLFTLTAAVAVESANGSVVWPFSIPVIAGEGPAQTAANQP